MLACVLLLASAVSPAADNVEALSKHNFQDYIRALTEQDFDALEQYYSEDIVVKFGETILDHAAVMQYEKSQAALLDSAIEVHRIIGDDTGVAIEATQVRTMLQDAPDNSVKAGTRFESHFVAFYTFANGKISALEVFNLPIRQAD